MASRGRKAGGGIKSKGPAIKRDAVESAPDKSAVASKMTKPPAAPPSSIGVAQLNLEAPKPAPAVKQTPQVRHDGGNGRRVAVEFETPIPVTDRPASPHDSAEIFEGTQTIESRKASPEEPDNVFDMGDDASKLSTLGSMPALQPPPQAKPPEPPAPVKPPPAPASPRKILEPALLFEIGWEVCWQLGGIYTVLRSKAATMLKTWGDRYCLVGPYNPVTAPVEFEPEEPDEYMAEAVKRMHDAGIPCYFGRWMIAGRPHVLLIDYRAKYRDLGSDKYLMWADHGISVPDNDGELNEVVAFGFACTEFFRHLSDIVTDRPILAHFHEWMAGVPVPRIAHLRLPISTVFTTHATLLGRYLAGDNPDFYNHLPFLNPDFEAKKYLIYPRYQIEKAATHASIVFTTVSEVTAYEAEKILGRRADAILPNGLNIQRFAALHEFQNLHRQYKEKIHEFVMGHFFPAYTFDLEKTIYLVTSGRYEYGNKGMDMFIEALYRLNQRMKYVPDHPTVVAFIITKAPVRHVNITALQSQTMFEELRRTCRDIQEEMGQRLFQVASCRKREDSEWDVGAEFA